MKSKSSSQSRHTRVKPRRILVPVDFSDSSARALRHATKRTAESGIMLSTPGLTGLDRYLIGSVADRVARLAPCPVVLLRPGKHAPSREQKPPPVLRIKRPSKPSS
jgi:hypothetical protein